MMDEGIKKGNGVQQYARSRLTVYEGRLHETYRRGDLDEITGYELRRIFRRC
jgi:hypothetical protein